MKSLLRSFARSCGQLATALAHTGGQGGVCDEAGHGFGQSINRLNGHQKTVVAIDHRFAAAGGVCGDDGAPHGHGL